jgi:predicted RNA-binding protein with PUA-like domain
MMARMAEGHWLAKSEPSKYPWQKLLQDKRTTWDGVRNFEARNNLRAMQKGDLVLFYHSNEGKEIVGVAKVVKTAYPDPTADEGDWSVVDLAPLKTLKVPVLLDVIKGDKKLAGMALLRRSRLSVVPVTPGEFARILELAETKL